ncbi:MAG: hypothetical protein CVU05_07365 [Bacteroidetes bacterium HGW-Bacteroidetes-21]|jgi:hypothetical protein|nr:MAG: hypothetical protein CVU05_07365 [Bacteroidetes bacterium HGW-Bacteroidetes-21]
MKKFFLLFGIAAAMVACGPSAEEQAAEQKKLDSLKQDSIMKVEMEAQRIQDSIAAAQAADTLAVDSTAVAPK